MVSNRILWNVLSDTGDLELESKPIKVDWKPRLIVLRKESKFAHLREKLRMEVLKILYEYFETRYGPEGALQEIR